MDQSRHKRWSLRYRRRVHCSRAARSRWLASGHEQSEQPGGTHSGPHHGVVLVRVLAVLALLVVFAPAPGCAQDSPSLRERARVALNTGDYAAAQRLYGDLLESEFDDTLLTALGRSFEAVGAYEEGVARFEALLKRGVDAPGLHHARGRLLEALGRYEEALNAYARALEANAACWACRVELGDLLVRTGRGRQAIGLYADVYLTWEQNQLRTAPELTIAGRAAAALERFRDANEAFRTAHAVDPSDVENLYRWAELFRGKYNDADARRTFEEALSINPRHAPSLVGMARSGYNFERQEALAREALAVNPNLTEALDLLASLQILDGEYDAAEATVRRALETNPRALSSLGHLASIHLLRGDSTEYEQVSLRALGEDPGPSEFYLVVAENAMHRYRYPEAVRLTREAVRADPQDARARAEYGMALLRIGKREEARHHLEAAFEADPFNLFASNTLTLIDELDAFAELESPHFRLLIHRDEEAVLGPLMLETAEAAYRDLSARYPYEPREKILIEAYNDADDFAVRVAGVPHRGLLGVCFGDVVAVNTPVAQGNDPYNWARTLWHEIAHTMAIGVSSFHVPRWFTEGLSVYEEGLARPEWGREMKLALLSAFDQDQLLPLDEIDRGFTRPSYPGQVMLSYYHAAQVIALIADDYGFDAITSMLQSFSSGASTEEALRQATGTEVAALDAALRTDLRDEQRRMARALEGIPDVLASEEAEVTAESAASAQGSFFAQLHAGGRALERGEHAAAESAFRNALNLYPDYVGPQNAYLGLAEVYRATDRPDALAEVLEQYLVRAEHDVAASLELAQLYASRGNTEAAIGLRERSLFVAPYDPDVRTALADAYDELGRFDLAVAHRQAVLALAPPDRAGAHYRLARSLFESGRTQEARRAVLQSLEIAPGYREAQELLLTLVGE